MIAKGTPSAITSTTLAKMIAAGADPRACTLGLRGDISC
jgi:hypothetical protein